MQTPQHELYVSTQGNDRWSGKLAEPNAERTDGPFATPGKARDVIRAARRQGELAGPVTVWLRGALPAHRTAHVHARRRLARHLRGLRQRAASSRRCTAHHRLAHGGSTVARLG